MKHFLGGITAFMLFSSFQQVPGQLETGAKAPYFTVPSKGNTQISYGSSDTTLLVFVHFWASWDAVSRKYNRETVKVYNRYKPVRTRDKAKLRIISISLDTRKELWEIALKQDNMLWKDQGCEALGWSSLSVDSFRVTRIPASFLIDRKGVIRATDLYGNDLVRVIDDLLVSN